MQKREVAITNRLGLHARASAEMVHLASQFRSRLTLEYAGRRADARSIIIALGTIPKRVEHRGQLTDAPE